METMNGWIKLSRGIRQNWVWNNPDWLKWWIDLLLLAAWEDTVVRKRRRKVLVKRGEVAMSERELQRRWGLKSPYAVRYFLNNLKDDGMITRYKRTLEQSVVQNVVQSVEQNGVQNVERSVVQNTKQSVVQFCHIISICNYESFQAVASGALCSSLSNPLSESLSSPLSNSLGEKQHKQPRVYNEEYKNIRNTTTDDDARARAREEFFEEDFLGGFLGEENADFLKWLASDLKIAEAEMRRRAEQIVEEWRGRAKKHKDYDDAAKHLIAQLRIRLAAERAAAAPRETARERARRELDEGVAAAMEQAQRAMAAREADELEERWSRLEAGHDYTEYEDVESD